ncbi:hypothetical protein Bbelb_217090 [Branchiostoma belcheri]|nr:hypothetical protein Bbelb_217090 [Branchiostoma belcheri]
MDKQPSQQDDKQAEVESVQEVESGVQEPAEMLMEVEVSGDEPVDDQDVQETGAWDNEGGFIFDPFTREDQLNVASMTQTMDLCMECEDEELDPWQMPAEPEPPPAKPAAAAPEPQSVTPQPPPLTPAVQQTTVTQQRNVLPPPPPLTPSPAMCHRGDWNPGGSGILLGEAQPVSTVSQKAVGQISQHATQIVTQKSAGPVKIVTQNSSTSQTTQPILINLTPQQGTSQPTYLMPATQPGGQSYYLMPLNVTGVPTLQTVSPSPVMLQQVPNIVQPQNVTIVRQQVPQILQVSQPAPAPAPASTMVQVIQSTTPRMTTSASSQLKTFANQATSNVAKPLYKLVTNNQAPSKTIQVTRPVTVTNTSTPTINQGPPFRPAMLSQSKPATAAHPVKITQAQPNPVAATTSQIRQVAQARTYPAMATPGQVQATQPQKHTVQETSAKTSTSAMPSGSVVSTVPSRRKKGLPPPRVVAKIMQDKTVMYVKCTESSSVTNNTTTVTQVQPSPTVQPVTVSTTSQVPLLPRPVTVAVHQALQSPSPMAIVNASTSATKVSSLTYTCPLCNTKFFSLASLTAHRQNCKKNSPALTAPPSQPVSLSAISSPSTSKPTSTPSPPNRTPPQYKSIQIQMSIEEYYYGKKEGVLPSDSTEDKGSCVFKCYTCSKVLKSNIKYMNHIRHHIEHERQQNPDISDVTSCQRCFKRFETPFQLQCHLETMHNTANPDTFCKICEISFKSEKALQSHMLQEHQPCEMPYSCKLCGFRSSILSDVESHFRSTHDGTKNLLCTFCLKIIVQCRAFDVHCLKHFRKSDKKKCKSCRLQFHSTSELQQHRKHDHVSFAGSHIVKYHRENAKLNFKFLKKGNKTQDPSSVVASSSGGVTEYGVAGMPRGIKRSLNLTCRPVQDNRTHTCLECGATIQDLGSHYMKYVSCSKCRYSTCCSRAYADHMICRHQAPGGRQRVVSANMFQVNMYTCETGMNMSCGCGYTTSGGREMAEHLQACYHKSCFLQSNPLKINVHSLTGLFRNRQTTDELQSAKRPRTDISGSGVEFVDLTEEEEEDDMAPGFFVCPHCDLHFNLRMPLTQHIKFCGPQQSQAEEDTYTVLDDVGRSGAASYPIPKRDSSTADNEDQQSDSEERDEQKEWEASIGLDAADISSNTVSERPHAEVISTAGDTSEGDSDGIVVKVEKEEVDSVMELQTPEELHITEDSGTATDDASKACSTEITIKVEKDENNPELNISEETGNKEIVSNEPTVGLVQDVAKESVREIREEIQPVTDTSSAEEEETLQDTDGTVNSDVTEQEDNQPTNKDCTEVETNTVSLSDDSLVSGNSPQHTVTFATKVIQDTPGECHVEELGFTDSTVAEPSTEGNPVPEVTDSVDDTDKTETSLEQQI